MSETLAHKIERFAIDSSSIKTAGYDHGTLCVEFTSGHLYAYQVPAEVFEAFASAESKGRFFGTQIRGKFTSAKLTGKCSACGSEPQIIGETCPECGCDTVRAIDTTHKERK